MRSAESYPDLENIEETSNDVFYDNAIYTYLNRPDDLLNIKYRDFYSNYVRDFKNCEKNEFKFRKLTKRIITRLNFYKKNCEEEKEAYYSQIILCNICLTKHHFDGNNKYIFNNLNATKTFKDECDILNLKDEDSPSFLFAD